MAYGRNGAALRHLSGSLLTFSEKYAIFSVSILCKMWNSLSGAHRFNKSRVFPVLFFPRSLKRYATICRCAPCRSMIQQVDLLGGSRDIARAATSNAPADLLQATEKPSVTSWFDINKGKSEPHTVESSIKMYQVYSATLASYVYCNQTYKGRAATFMFIYVCSRCKSEFLC